MTGTRPGYALLVSMLMVLALATLALGSVAVGTREGVLAATLLRTERARVLAETEAMDASRAWSSHRYRALPVGGTMSAPGGTTVERVGPDLFLVRAAASVPGGVGPVTASSSVLVRAFDVGPIEAQLLAAATAEVDAVLETGRLAAGGGCGAPAGPGLAAPVASIGAGVTLTGSPPHAPTPAGGLPAPDPVADSLIARLADLHVPASTVSPRPSTASGTCLPAPDNWGSPDPAHACHAHLPVVHTAGPLIVTGGQARALILADGPLTLDGATVHGVILVRGTLTLQAGARIRGAVRARHILLRDGSIDGDPCETDAALSAPTLDRPFRLPERWWIPMF